MSEIKCNAKNSFFCIYKGDDSNDDKVAALEAKLAAAEETLRHTCKHLCQWKDACEVGCPVSAALTDTPTDEVQP